MMSGKPQPIKSQEQLKSWFGGRIPIVIGTVGHRDLSTTAPAIVRTIRKECRRLRKMYRDSPFLILSGLAEGADGLIAGIAREELEALLVAVLPFPAAEFYADFETEASRQEFSSLLSQVVATSEVPLPSDEIWKEKGPARDKQYARVGALIAEQSHILVALWDGRPEREIGDTAQVVSWFERGYASSEYSFYEGDLSLFHPPQPGLCIRIDPITAEREIRGSGLGTRSFELFGQTNIHEILQRTNAYNQDVHRHAAHGVKRERIIPPRVVRQLQIVEADATFSEADALSNYFARRTRLATLVFFALAMVAILASASVDTKPLASWGFLVIIAIQAGVASYVLSQSLDTKFLEYRSFAEAMRILLFWRLLNVKRHVWLSYLSRLNTSIGWLRHAVRAVEFAQDLHRPPTSDAISDEELINVAVGRWLGHQIDYFTRAMRKRFRQYWLGLWVARAAIVLTAATSVVLAVMTFTFGNGLQSWHPQAIVPLPFGPMPIADFIFQLQVTVGLMAALAVAARGFLFRRIDRELANQYAIAKQRFEMAKQEIEDMAGDQQPHQIFERLGRDALLQQAEWLSRSHPRPFDTPN